jgi:two-component system, chemotaxis family, protein-glutamate methylesterase/glutaminase
MPNRDIVVIGGSAGSFTALQALLPQLPPGLPAAVFVLIHGGGRSESLARLCALEVEVARDGAEVEPSRLYVAPPDVHLLLEGGRMHLRRSARENLARPSIDVLFRSAAVEFGSRVIGVLLSGTLYDGAAGLQAVARCGGTTIVQEPSDASFPEMPEHAIAADSPRHRVPADQIGHLLVDLVGAPAGPSPPAPRDLVVAARMASRTEGSLDLSSLGELSPLTCPECGGSLREIEDGQTLQYRCHVGHAYDSQLLLAAQSEVVERALWSALRAHEDRGFLLRRMAEEASARNRARSAGHWERVAAEHEEHARAIRRVLAAVPEPVPSADGET